MKSPEASPTLAWSVSAQDGAKHSIGVTSSGNVYTWGPNNTVGQLGRDGKAKNPQLVDIPVKATRAFVGGLVDSGHSAILDKNGHLWLCGCDRWQQLGLGSSSGGTLGYTWVGGKINQSRFQRNDVVTELLKKHDGNAEIRDVSLGGDHTIVLSSNKRDVFVFGKGGDGQLGLPQKSFLSAPVKSTSLSSDEHNVAAVCAINCCSITLDENGNALKQIGRCRATEAFAKSIAACRLRADHAGLLKRNIPPS